MSEISTIALALSLPSLLLLVARCLLSLRSRLLQISAQGADITLKNLVRWKKS
jgi:hypothetical protein